ncbi:hypothetical protein KC878_00235 [Candidatus Saccharibacteria bacterium]|nr:hypothetical protein [Candidatus Saccharibacteria bacterium]MCB9821042.1 hypothetical protein [Candidatus Nomurabacteria bacterium]
MKNHDKFLDFCKRTIKDYDANKLDLLTAAAKIRDYGYDDFEYSLPGDSHPMLFKIGDLAFDIAEAYRSADEDQTDWSTLCRTVEDFELGNWESTCWQLSIIYGASKHSYSVVIDRQNGRTQVNTTLPGAKTALKPIIAQIRIAQTDQRYLQNLARLMPKTIGEFELRDASVREYLVEPYYSTAI